ncbi:MAG: DUF2142 domain-containing protein [Pseudobacteriovorax sp.]|nr:DUF2142 domain-containing protein [Pseudobacteriovorax sp.]
MLTNIFHTVSSSVADVNKNLDSIYLTTKFKAFAFFILVLLSAWFLRQSYFFQKHVSVNIPPDEKHHAKVIELYHLSPDLDVPESPSTYKYGTLNYMPYLYHLAMGKMLPFYDYKSLRLANWSFAVVFILLSALLVVRSSSNPWVWIFSFMILTNIPMLSFIFGSISYDPLINCLGVAFCLCLLEFFRQEKWRFLFALGVIAMTGTLVKLTFLPFILISLIVLLFKYRALKRLLEKGMLKNRLTILISGVVLGGLFFLNCRLYLYNLFEFRSIYPSADQVWGHDVAFQYYSQYRITEQMIEANKNSDLMPFFFTYIEAYFKRATETIVGIMAHASVPRGSADIRLYLNGVTLAMIGTVYYGLRQVSQGKIKSSPEFRYQILLSIIVLIYGTIVLVSSYRSYTIHGTFGGGLQGRYHFPIVVGFCIMLALGLKTLIPNIVKPFVAIFIFSFLHFMGTPTIVTAMSKKHNFFSKDYSKRTELIVGDAMWNEPFELILPFLVKKRD